MKLYVTYSFGSNLANYYSVVEADTEEACLERIWSVCGGKYSFTYSEKNFKGQIEAYNLGEVELQPQESCNMETELKIEVGKSYVTRNGKKAKVIATNANNDCHVVVLVDLDGNGQEQAWHYHTSGAFVDGQQSPEDLISEWHDWIFLPVDTKLRVKNTLDEAWEHRHFARWDPLTKKVRAWDNGKTSHTISYGDTSCWNIAEIVK